MLGLTWGEFYDATPREFFNRLEGWQNAEEIRQQGEWERARLIAYYAISPYLKKGDTRMEKVIPLPWDKRARAPKVKISKEEHERLQALLDKAHRADLKWQKQ